MHQEKRHEIRNRRIESLVNKEIEHLTMLKSINEIYSNQNPTKNTPDTQCLDSRKLNLVFICVAELAAISENFVTSFRQDTQFNVGGWFLSNFNPLKNAISVYAQNFEFLSRFVEARHQRVVKDDQEHCADFQLNELMFKTHTASVHSLLLKPIKHVLNYPDFICELLQVFELEI
jgi:hypothetical protein